jgi:hypothetical protein
LGISTLQHAWFGWNYFGILDYVKYFINVSSQLILKNKKFIQENIPKYSNGMIIAHLGIAY